MKEAIEKKFVDCVLEWDCHCSKPEIKLSSKSSDYLNCDAYREIVRMGPKALPLIKHIYSGRDSFAFFPILGWSNAVQEIVGDDFQIPEEIRGKVKDIRDYTVKWLDENMKKYI